jgi:solute carrier family 25 protein 39/40
LENLKIELGARIKDFPNVVNLTSAMLASSVTATMTLPLDVVKTRKQVSTRSDLHH